VEETKVELKRCPFCRSRVIATLGNGSWWWVTCENCGCDGPTMSTKDRAIEAWNTRGGRGKTGEQLRGTKERKQNTRRKVRKVTSSVRPDDQGL
jgi:hypothetical protein